MSSRDLWGYRSFVAGNTRFLGYGLALTFASSCGQTFFLSGFSGHIKESLGLTDGDIGTIYSAATLVSACLLPWVGRLIDVVDLRLYSIAVCLGLIAGCFVMASVTNTVVLFLGYLLMRQFGQGLLGHAAGTSMARYFEKQRGKAMSLVALGYPLGEAIFPAALVLAFDVMEWRAVWSVTGIAVAVILVPLVGWLLRGHAARHRRLEEQLHLEKTTTATTGGWTRGEVLRHPRFYFVLPAVLCPPFIGTGVFFHRDRLCEVKGWEDAMFAGAFTAYAAATIVMSFIAGTLVDRFGGRRLVGFYLIPQAIGLLLLALGESGGFAFGFMICAGITAGAGSATVGALWAELYGVANIGAIRSLVYGVMVFATACAPGPLGKLLDYGVSVATLCVAGAIGTFLAGTMAGVAARPR